MKKNIILILIIILIVCGCSEKNKITQNNDSNKNEKEVLTRDKIFKEQAIKIYGDYELTKEKVGYYVTPLSAILRITTGYELTFKGCNQDQTYMAYEIFEEDDEIKSNLRFVFQCDGKNETYFYDGLHDEEPIVY